MSPRVAWAGTHSFALTDLLVKFDSSLSVAPAVKRAKFTKNPTVDTSFLPDREREQREAFEREELRRQWIKNQETIKAEDIEITYSYWDGAGHRRVVSVSLTILRPCVASRWPDLRHPLLRQRITGKERR